VDPRFQGVDISLPEKKGGTLDVAEGKNHLEKHRAESVRPQREGLQFDVGESRASIHEKGGVSRVYNVRQERKEKIELKKGHPSIWPEAKSYRKRGGCLRRQKGNALAVRRRIHPFPRGRTPRCPQTVLFVGETLRAKGCQGIQQATTSPKRPAGEGEIMHRQKPPSRGEVATRYKGKGFRQPYSGGSRGVQGREGAKH